MANSVTNRAILSAIESMDRKLEGQNATLARHGERLATIESTLCRIPDTEKEVKALSRKVYWFSGFAAGFGALIHFIFPVTRSK